MKKFKKWWYHTGDLLVTIIVTVLLMVATCFFGYIIGTMDGYAEGYVAASTNQYTQLPEHHAFENAMSYGDSLKHNTKILLEDLSGPRERKVVEHNISIQYRDDAFNIDEAINEALSIIPASIIKQFEDEQWQIIVYNTLQSFEYKNTDFVAVGATNTAEHTIQLEANAGIAAETLIHEFGHYFDTTNGRYSDSEEWVKLYSEEWEGVYTLTRNFHDIDSPAEYFAEIFYWSLYSPQTIQVLCPASYNVMHDLIEDFALH